MNVSRQFWPMTRLHGDIDLLECSAEEAAREHARRMAVRMCHAYQAVDYCFCDEEVPS